MHLGIAGFRRLEIVRFTAIGPVKAGWMVKGKSGWLLTEAGRQAYATMPDPEAFFREASRLYRDWKRNRPPFDPEADAADDIEGALDEAPATSNKATLDVDAGAGRGGRLG